jgi:hypothetical protein
MQTHVHELLTRAIGSGATAGGVGGGSIRRRDAQGAWTLRGDEGRHALCLARRIAAKKAEREVHRPRRGASAR